MRETELFLLCGLVGGSGEEQEGGHCRVTEASGLGDWGDDVGQRRIIVGGAVADGLVPSSSESDVFADCCRRHSQRERERVER